MITDRLTREVTAIYDGKLCGSSKKAECAEKAGQYLAWECGKCQEAGEIIDETTIMPLTHHCLRIRRMIVGGARIGLDDLDLATWERLGIIADVIDAIHRKQQAMLMMPKYMRM